MSSSTTSEPKQEAPPLGKYLASTEKKTRDKAIKSLATFLSDDSQKSMSPIERTKLWKGLFYCFWMSDKPLVQQDLSQELANLILLIPSLQPAIGFLHGFWEAMVREWAGIDRFRRFVNATFRLLLRHGWQPEACDTVNKILKGKGGPLCPDDKRVPASLSYHLADIYLEELDKALNTTDQASTPKSHEPSGFSQFHTVQTRTSNKITYGRMQTALFVPLLDALSARSSLSNTDELDSQQRKRKRSSEIYPNLTESMCEPGTENAGNHLAQAIKSPQDVTRDVLKAIFDAAGDADTKDANRRKMYALWKERTEALEGPPEGDRILH
ncbi:Ribosomal RNA-processing-like protein [Ceratobasidium theobromae]|uniref:Ribosomal RNA-processing-like protein n=1 Tax=Ceratobasidium theobromae TaxID=1582974 RepID=A0A5N5QSA6_9AGAM|nr:Ribosomal RNA-processing-like protein [Ceratobasidium theobromae]